MKWLPQGLAGRLLLAFVVAAGAIAALAVSVRERDQARAAERRAATNAPSSVPVPLAVAIAPCRGRVLLARRIEALPPDTAPVVQVFADGSAAVRRPAPLATGPEVDATAGDAAILLPAASLGALEPAARTALLDLIGRFVALRPVPPDRVRSAGDVAAPAHELEPLLRWVP